MEITQIERTLVAAIKGELDHVEAEKLRPQIDTAFDNSPCKHIIFDMGGVQFMDSSGIGMIIGRYKNAQQRGGQVVITNMTLPITRLYEISGLKKIILSADTVDAGLNLVGGRHSDR